MQNKIKIRKNNIHPVTLNALICGALFLGIYLFQFYFPVAYNYFTTEDSWVEYGTFVFYLLASFLILGAIKMDSSIRRPGYVLLSIALFFVAMEEISWGQRLFGLRTPYIIAQHNWQSEIGIHNASFFPSASILSVAILIWALILPEISRKFSRINEFFNKMGVPLVSHEQQPYFIFGFFLKNFKVVIRNDELGEMVFGLAFAIFAIGVFYKACKETKRIKVTSSQLMGFSMLAVLIMTFLLIKLGPQDVYALRRKLHNSAITEYPRCGMNAQAKEIFEYLVQHEELKNDDTLFQYGLFLKKMNGSEAEGVFSEALREARERMLKTPDKPAPNILAGKILKQLNQTNLAEAEFREALKKDEIRLAQAQLDWQRTDALKSMGETYIEMGKHDLAVESLKKAFDYAEDGWTKLKIETLLKTIDSP